MMHVVAEAQPADATICTDGNITKFAVSICVVSGEEDNGEPST
jgi:hypothetical protein